MAFISTTRLATWLRQGIGVFYSGVQVFCGGWALDSTLCDWLAMMPLKIWRTLSDIYFSGKPSNVTLFPVHASYVYIYIYIINGKDSNFRWSMWFIWRSVFMVKDKLEITGAYFPYIVYLYVKSAPSLSLYV